MPSPSRKRQAGGSRLARTLNDSFHRTPMTAPGRVETLGGGPSCRITGEGLSPATTGRWPLFRKADAEWDRAPVSCRWPGHATFRVRQAVSERFRRRPAPSRGHSPDGHHGERSVGSRRWERGAASPDCVRNPLRSYTGPGRLIEPGSGIQVGSGLTNMTH